VPTISVGAGPHCDGQAVLLSDITGMYPVFTPKFVKRYATVGDDIVKAVSQFVEETKSGVYPGPEHCYKMKEGETERLEAMLRDQQKSS